MSNKYYPGPRFEMPDVRRQIENPYDHDSGTFQDLVARNLRPVFVQTLNLGTAGQLLLNVEGYHFVIYGHDGSSNKAVDTTVLVNAWINLQTNDGTTPFPAKHARGFTGPFEKLYIEWPAQTNLGNPRYCDMIIFKTPMKPWIDGEAPT